MTMDIYTAHYRATAAANALLRHHTLVILDHMTSGFWLDDGIEELKKCADALGFDLVPRQTPAEKHSEAIAACVSQDAPHFGTRDTSRVECVTHVSADDRPEAMTR